MTPQELANAARCIECNIPPGLQPAIIIYLLQQIAAGSAVSSQLSQGHGAPTSPPTNPNASALYSDLDADGTTYVWNVETQAWL